MSENRTSQVCDFLTHTNNHVWRRRRLEDPWLCEQAMMVSDMFSPHECHWRQWHVSHREASVQLTQPQMWSYRLLYV